MPRSPRTSTHTAGNPSSGDHQRHRRERKRENKPVMPGESVPRIGDDGEGVSMDRRVGMSQYSQERDRKRHNRLTSSTNSGRGPADSPARRNHVFSASNTAALGSVIDLDDTPAPTPAPSRASVHGPSSLSLNRAQRQSGSLPVYPTPRYDIDFNSLVGHYISAPSTSEPRLSQGTSTAGPGPSTQVGPDPFERITQLELELSSMTCLRDELRDENESLHGWRKASAKQLKAARSQVDHLIEQTWGLESKMASGAELFGPVISDAIVGSLRTGSERGDELKVETPFQSGGSGDPTGVDDDGDVAGESVSANDPVAARTPGQDTRTIRQLQLELQRQSSRYDDLKAQQISEKRELEECLRNTKQTHAKELKAKDEEIQSLEKRLQDREASHSKLMSDMVERKTREYALYSDRMEKKCSKLGIEAKYFKAMVEAMCGRVDRLEKQLALLKRSTSQPPIQEPSFTQSKLSSLAEPPSAILESLAEVVAREGAILTRDGSVINPEVNCDASGDGFRGGLDQGIIHWGGVKDYSRSHWQDTESAESKQRAIDLMRHWDNEKKEYWASGGSNLQLHPTSGRAGSGDQDEEEMLMNGGAR